MAVQMKGKDILSIHDLSREEVRQILDTARVLKIKKLTGEVFQPLKGKTLGMIFQKASTRTRISFEVAMWQLGGYALYLNAADLQLRRGETIADTARVLSRYLDALMIRTYAHQDVVELAAYSDIPVINGLTDLLHPCQALSDLFTIEEKKGTLAGLKLVYVGDGNNMAHSLMYAGAKVGMHVTVCCPPNYMPDAEVTRLAREDAAASGAVIDIVHDPVSAVKDADIIYTDVWASMGQEEEHAKRVKIFAPYQVNRDLVEKAKPDVMIMHCLPAHRGEEITDEVLDDRRSIVFDQAENRLHVQKAILALII
ncbi:MAG: ornithine carbamoyltransferase [Firmicutes bacterium]|jgi:ornithine carbamoyltransferase|nr:ornithine carbamoyltransferase [Bacillota bacterium]HPU01082.1 ornithine carbamoyltransferase [Bacillota bacterium]